MSIGDLHIFTRIDLSMFTIYENRFLCYNKALIEKVSLFYGTPEGEKCVAVSKSQQKAVHKYVKTNYDRMELTVPKGQKEIIKAHAEARSESVNGFVNRAISETMERDNNATEANEGR